MKVIEQLSR